MITHFKLGATPDERRRKLLPLILRNRIHFGGHKKLKIYGLLSCSSGKQMKAENRVFFDTEEEAVNAGYRPCGHCMVEEYRKWKRGR